jgi:LysM domain
MLVLLLAVGAVGAIIVSSGFVTPRSPADAALHWGDHLLGLDHGSEGGAGSPQRRTRRRTYRVRPGDTLGRVSRRTGLSVRELRALNPGLDPLNLQRGRVLRLRS